MRRMTVMPEKERRINFEERSQGNAMLVTALWIVLGIIAAVFLIVGISYAGEVALNSLELVPVIYPAVR